MSEIDLEKLKQLLREAVKAELEPLEQRIGKVEGEVKSLCELYPELCKKLEPLEQATIDFDTQQLLKHLEVCPTCRTAVLDWARKKLEGEKKHEREEGEEKRKEKRGWSPSQI